MLDLGLGKPLKSVFTVAVVTQSILYWDFLQHFGLMGDAKETALEEIDTSRRVQGQPCSPVSPASAFSIVPSEAKTIYLRILEKFPDLTRS